MTRPEMARQGIARVRVKSSVLARPVGDQIVLLDLDSGRYFSLNAVGAFIWQHLERGEGPAAIADRLTAEYEVSAEQAAADLQELLADLVAHGLVTASDGC